MTIRSDVKLDFDLVPRLAEIADTSVTINAQDLYDTLRAFESKPIALSEDSLISGSGKEPLGGGAEVGITNQLEGTKLSFAARTASAQSGTVTTPDTNGVTLTDTAALFQTNGILPGAWILNITDQSAATVLSVTSETVLVCQPLDDGSDNQWDSADVYKIWNVVQCTVTGGNLVARDAAKVAFPAIFPTMGTQVVIQQSTSPGLIPGSAPADIWAHVDPVSSKSVLTLQRGEADGMRSEQALAILLSLTAGKYTVTDLGGGIKRVIFFLRDGTTEVFRGNVQATGRDTITITVPP